MYLNILKNPVVLAVLAGILTYLYMWYSNRNRKEKDKRDINLMYPLVVAIIVGVVSYLYFNYSNTSTNISAEAVEQIVNDSTIVKPTNSYQFAKDITSESPVSFHLISKGINVPNQIQNIPDVFIDVYE
jgi:hypothetical protein